MSGHAEVVRWFKKSYMDPISPTFCLAKWFEGTMWLYMGMTASCHHTPYHQVDITNNCSDIFNTSKKKMERDGMLYGIPVTECSYCWSVEKHSDLSDRIMKSEKLGAMPILGWSNPRTIPMSVQPLVLEVAFDRICNLGCWYCHPSFSTRWVADLEKNGPYGLKSADRFDSDQCDTTLGKSATEKFLEWWPTLSKTLRQLNLTGGEPLVSNQCWEFIEGTSTFEGQLIINSNLIVSEDRVRRLVELRKGKHLRVHTSLESGFSDATYTRDGFNEGVWLRNVRYLLSNRIQVIVSSSINCLSVWTLDEYVRIVSDLKAEYGGDMISLNFNFVKNPVIAQVQVVPIEYRVEIADRVAGLFTDQSVFRKEWMQIERGLEFLRSAHYVDEHISSLEQVRHDLVKFVEQFDSRRGTDHKKLLSQACLRWLGSL